MSTLNSREQDGQLVVVDRLGVGRLDRVDERRTERSHHVEGALGDGVEPGVRRLAAGEQPPIDPDPGPAQRAAHAGTPGSRAGVAGHARSPKGERSTLSAIAASVTVRAIGPAVSWLWAIGTIPAWATSPTVGLRPTIALLPAGQTIEPSVSVPTAIAHRFAAAATAEPELEPHGSSARPYGLRVKPPRALQPLR